MRKIFFLLFIFSVGQLHAQSLGIEPTITPTFFSADEEITITYDVTGTFMDNWTEAWIWLWLPEATNVNVTSNINPASANATATNPAKFTKISNGGQEFFSLTLKLTDFTGEPKENITKVGMLIKGNDWSDGQSIDYVTEISDEFTLRLNSPTDTYGFYNSVQDIDIEAETSEPSTIEMYLDDVFVESVADQTNLTTTHTILNDGLVHEIKIIAATSTETQEVHYSYTLTPTPVLATLPPGAIDGVNYDPIDDTKATLLLTAPNKNHIFVIGDFNSWGLGSEYLMNQDGEKFWVTLTNLVPGKEYVFQYLIDGQLRIADPYTDKVSDPWDDKHIDETTYPGLIDYPDQFTSNRASILQTGQIPYEWINTNFVAPPKEKLAIYELLIRDFDEKHSYKSVIDKLDYLEGLGINAIELMPTNEFEGNLSWGYNPNFYFAPDKYYGTKNDLKALIDACHSRGIAVILDLVLNHSYGSSPLARMYWDESSGKPAADNPWYNVDHNFQNPDAHWGTDFDHESTYTKNLVDSINSYWINEYKVDGFRFDFTKGFGNQIKSNSSDSWGSNYDASRIALLERMADKIWEVNSNAYVIFEHLAENSEEQELANYGIMLWGNMNHSYRRVAKGNAESLSWLYHTYRGWDEPNVVGYMESHDEERVAWDVLKTWNIEQAMQRLQMNAAFFFTVPGPKMIWQFEEMGYDEELNNDRLGIKPTHWEYLDDPDRKRLFDVYTSLINLRTKTDYIDSEYFTWSATPNMKYININHPDVAFSIIGNFGKTTLTGNAHFTKNGTWHDYFSGITKEVTDFANEEISLAAGEFKIYTTEPIDNYLDSNPIITGSEMEFTTRQVAYPNPTRSSINISVTAEGSNYYLVDLLGNTLKLVPEVTNYEARFDVSHLRPGMYFIKSISEDKSQLVRFIKQ